MDFAHDSSPLVFRSKMRLRVEVGVRWRTPTGSPIAHENTSWCPAQLARGATPAEECTAPEHEVPWYKHVWEIRSRVGQSYVYGFRVPPLVVSAYMPAGYVSNSNHDFGSFLKFTEVNFGLGLIGTGNYADSYADDLAEFFTPTKARTFSTITSKYKGNYFFHCCEPADEPDND
jgi:Phosphoesterase family